jgi:hypothetical protein
MRSIPKHSELVFKENPACPGIYDLTGSKYKPFSFVRLSEPRSDFLIRQGAKYVIESWNHGEKPLFTGLRPFSEGMYYGDRIKAGKRVLLIARMQPGELVIYLFKTHPKGKRFAEVLRGFPETINPRNHPGVKLSPTNPATGSESTTKVLN